MRFHVGDGVLIVECYENDSLDHIHEGSFNTTPTGDVIGREDLNTIYGVIGIKVWIYKGEVMERKPIPEAEPTTKDRG